eukprot:scaffold248391_cov70-Cyclotella_meneghiniana.AAC.12
MMGDWKNPIGSKSQLHKETCLQKHYKNVFIAAVHDVIGFKVSRIDDTCNLLIKGRFGYHDTNYSCSTGPVYMGLPVKSKVFSVILHY